MSSLRYSRIVVFDSYLRDNFYPLSLTRPTFDFLCGTKTLLENIESSVGSKVTDLIVPKYLEALCGKAHPEQRINERVGEKCLAVNSLMSPSFPLAHHLEKLSESHQGNFIAVDSSGNPVVGLFDELHPEVLASSSSSVTPSAASLQTAGPHRVPLDVSVSEEEQPLLRFPWDIVSQNGKAIQKQGSSIIPRIQSEEGSGFEILGPNLRMAGSARVERYVTFDTRGGDIVVDENASIHSFSHITGPAYIGKNSVVKSAKIRKGTSIAHDSRVSGEIEETIIFEYTNKYHDGFLGHSIIGSWVNLGALTTTSDLKNTYGPIKVNLSSSPNFNTASTKVGCFLGDMCKTSIGTLILSGKTIGISSHLFGTVSEDVPSFTLYAKSMGLESKELYIESAIETQRRMMERRDVRMSANYVEMIKSIYNITAKDRIANQVKKGKFEFL